MDRLWTPEEARLERAIGDAQAWLVEAEKFRRMLSQVVRKAKA
jgi:hypothetical protein